jgi:23S rRNA (guanosine2251-2'-O)-methyltransferase
VPRDVVSGRRAVLEAVRTGIASRVLVVRGARSTEGLRDVLSAAQEHAVPVREADRAELDRLATDHRGVVATVRIRARSANVSWPSGRSAKGTWSWSWTASHDPQNLGAAARSAEAAGAPCS